MGLYYKGGIQTFHGVTNNISKTAKHFGFSNGYFGEPGTSSRVRVIFDKDPATAGERFFDLIAYGGIEEFLPNGKGIKVSMADGTIITFRPKTKSDNYPGVTINVIKSKKHGDLKDQKIHFEKG